MAEQDRSRGQAAVWRPWSAARRRPALVWPERTSELARRAAQHIRAWSEAELGAGRLVPWLAVAFGCGIVVYFTVDREPAPWAAVALFATTVAITALSRHRGIAFALAMGATAAAAGFATATIKRLIIAHPVLSAPLWNVEITGFVETREERERTDRIVVRVERMAAAQLEEKLDRVRVAVRKGTAPAVGSFVELKARLTPPLQPLRPGGYDFARDMYFQRLGASGFVLGRIRVAEAPQAPDLRLRYATAIEGMREAIDNRIRALVPGDTGAIASALLTGKRDAISKQVNDAMYVSGLGHVLSISGYHMAVVVGIVFFALRASLALMPGFGRYPIKKWAAGAALAGAAFYLLLSGAEVATQRSFIMVAIVLVGVLVDRPTLTFRTLTVAAFAVLLLAPESIVHPSFQMSFAATLALVAGYQHGLPWMSKAGDTPLSARMALAGARWISGLLLVSMLAGAATIPYVAYHFHRVSPYGIVANLVAMPIVSVWVMPTGIAGLLTMPLGLDAMCWRTMGLGVEWMVEVARWISSFPGALGRMGAFGIGPLLLCTLGIVLLCLLKTPLRLLGPLLIGCAIIMMLRAPRPDVLIAADGATVAARGADGMLAVVRSGNDVFALREWLAADGDARDPKAMTLGNDIRCDAAGCIAKLRDGSLVAVARTTEAFQEDCRRAVMVVTARDAPSDCAAAVIDRQVSSRHGAMTLRRIGEGFEITPTRPAGYDRPWARAAPHAGPVPEVRPQRDATPRADDLEAGD